MTFTLVILPPTLPGEYTYPCTDAAHLRKVSAALTTLGVEVIDVLNETGESLTAAAYAELLGE